MSSDLGISLPPTWRRTTAPDQGVLVAARAGTTPTSGFRPELVLHYGSPPLDDLVGRLQDLAVEDEDEFDLFGHDVSYRRFAHRVGALDVVCDQWSWPAAGVTLTCSVARQDYWDYCDVFEAIAEAVDLGPRPGPA